MLNLTRFLKRKVLRCVDIVFCLDPIHASKQRPKKSRKLENVQNHEFQSQKR